jgi:hypothetical protein
MRFRAIEHRNGPIEILKSAARDHALSRHVPELSAQMIDDRVFAMRRGREARMPPLARNHHRALRARDQARNAKTRSGSEHGHRCFGHRSASTERA